MDPLPGRFFLSRMQRDNFRAMLLRLLSASLLSFIHEYIININPGNYERKYEADWRNGSQLILVMCVCVFDSIRVLCYEVLEIVLCIFVKICSAMKRAHDFGKSDFVYLMHVYILAFLFIIPKQKLLATHVIFFSFFWAKSKMWFSFFFLFQTVFTSDILVSNQSNRKNQIDGDLHINFVRRNDSGYYRCVRSQAGEHNHRTDISTIIKLETICK